jgi:hypothetical protein
MIDKQYLILKPYVAVKNKIFHYVVVFRHIGS